MPFWNREKPQPTPQKEQQSVQLHTDWVEPALIDFFRFNFPDEGVLILSRPFSEWARVDMGQLLANLPDQEQRHEILKQRAELLEKRSAGAQVEMVEHLIAVQGAYFDELQAAIVSVEEQLTAQSGSEYEKVIGLVNENLRKYMWNFWLFEKSELLSSIKILHAQIFNALYDPEGYFRSAGVSPKTSFTGIGSEFRKPIVETVAEYYAAGIVQQMFKELKNELAHTPVAKSYNEVDREYRKKEISAADQKFIDGVAVRWEKGI